MPYNLAILPLLGGFIFITYCNATSYSSRRQEGYRLLLYSAVAGVVLLLTSRLLIFYLDVNSVLPTDHRINLAVGCLIAIAGLLFGNVFLRRASKLGDSDDKRNDPNVDSRARQISPGTRRLIFFALATVATLYAMSVYVLPHRLPLAVVSFATGIVLIIAIVGECVSWRSVIRHDLIIFRLSVWVVALIGITLILDLATPGVAAHVKLIAPFKYGGTTFLAFLLGPVSALFVNSVYPSTSATSHLIFGRSAENTSIERFLAHSMNLNKLIQITLRDNKVYVGYVIDLPANPYKDRAVVKILPVVSGYRDSVTHQMHLPVDYMDAYSQYISIDELGTDEKTLDTSDIEEKIAKILMIAEIKTLGNFDLNLYRRFSNTGLDKDNAEKTATPGTPPSRGRFRRKSLK